jgi:(1->4)-alpha-D-glucan 1-alpha-D-glucosylmutase
VPLRATGAFADCCISFARQLDRSWIIVIVPRLSSRIGFPPIGDRWGDTAVELPEDLSLESAREIFTGRELSIQNRKIRLAEAMSILPFAMVTS